MKISVIMQAYLGDYPGARSNPREKFVRAVNSFLSQTHTDKELIIVSDGCPIVVQIYEAVYKSNPMIKLVDLEQDYHKKTYERSEGKYCFRGYPKSIGLSHATGDLVCYLDSDDLILPYYLHTLNAYWLDIPDEIKWASNNVRIVHNRLLSLSGDKEYKVSYSNEKIDLSTYGIVEPFFINLSVPFGQLSCATSSLSHRREISAIWKDTINEHEDLDFARQLQEKHGNSLRMTVPGYVVCHYIREWDC